MITAGLTKIEIGEIAVDGGMSTTLETICYTKDGGVKLVVEDPQVTEFIPEELDDPIDSISKKGKTTIEWTLLDPDADALVAVMGGTAVAGVWSQPRTQPTIEKSLKITPNKGLVVACPRVSIVGKIDAEFSKKGSFSVVVKATVMAPTKANTEPLTATPLV